MDALTDEDIRLIARKRASYALGEIATWQMSTWVARDNSRTAKDIIADQIAEAMFDVIKGNRP